MASLFRQALWKMHEDGFVWASGDSTYLYLINQANFSRVIILAMLLGYKLNIVSTPSIVFGLVFTAFVDIL